MKVYVVSDGQDIVAAYTSRRRAAERQMDCNQYYDTNNFRTTELTLDE